MMDCEDNTSVPPFVRVLVWDDTTETETETEIETETETETEVEHENEIDRR